MRANKEYQICKNIATYLRLQYPMVLFHFDLAGLNLSKTQAGMAKSIQGLKGFPDLTILEARGGFHALFLEIKVESPYKKNGDLFSNPHLQQQDFFHQKLREKGYYVTFSAGFDESKKIIDSYMQLK